MAGADVLASLRDGRAGFLAGVTWLPDEVLEVLSAETGPGAPAQALVTLCAHLSLDFVFVPANRAWSRVAVERLHRAGTAACWAVPGVLGRAAERLGWAETLRRSAGDPGALAAELDAALHAALEEVRQGLAYGCGAVVVADDVAGATGWLVSPDFAFDALMPCYRALAGQVQSGGAAAIFHSDGDIRLLMSALARGGFSAVHIAGLDIDAIGVQWRAARGAGLLSLGGLRAASIALEPAELGERAGQMALAGGLLVCDDGGISTAEQVSAFEVALSAARQTYGADLEVT